MESASKNKAKKKRVAPLSKKTADTSQNTPLDDDFVFTDDMLEDIFKEAESAERSSKVDSSKQTDINASSSTSRTGEGDMVDLDDWIPPSLKKEPEKPMTWSNKANATRDSQEKLKTERVQSTSSNMPVPKSRKEMLFSSIEFEEDSTLRLRFVKRNTPASKLKELNSELKQVSLYDAPRLSEQEKDWYTFGVVSDFGQLKKEGSGRMDVTDLTAEPYTVRFLLFGTAFSGLPKIPVGAIVTISRPKKGKPFNGKEAFIVNNADQIIVAGMSRDFGLCGSSKKSGGACRAVVNLNICRYCKFHVASVYKDQKMAKELKAAAAGVGLGIKPSTPGLWNTQPNQNRFLNTAKKNITQMKKDSERLSKLNNLNSTTSSSTVPHRKPALTFEAAIGSEPPKLDLGALKARVAARKSTEQNLKRQMSGSSDDDEGPQIKKPLMEVINTPPAVAMTSRFEPSASPRMSAAKLKALQFIRENGTISTDKPKPKFQEGKEEEEDKKPNGITPEFLALMKEKPMNPTLLKDAEALMQEKRFEKLKVIEEVSEKLVATHEVPVRAIRCLVCKKNFHAMPMQCVLNKHACKVVAGTKRFFECNSCRNRTTTLERLPTTECAKCGVWSWRRAGMAADRVCSVAPQLAVRGLEEKFVNSVVKDPNLNLLMPDE